ncbi:SspB family protein [Roseospirillum parvum]|uniref:Stringent starvation protein B n=1 Tax=Roseospirillum parvum TaxID=83401 RepID=A0A1G7ZEB4_9PROT|nr:ClpXP protease specificity-enhancing factor SspB [Roseospirillum parvum]SDH06979.1 hypothetical protein SAMN05421742_10483 [Roseospirillum parvum]
MLSDHIDGFSYERMVEDALRGVLREALMVTARQGLPGQHHFYITFLTGHSDVDIPPELKAGHPEEMTIVLQNKFWDLDVNELGFAVTLSFNQLNKRLVVPFAAVTAFADPHAKFGLQFHAEGAEGWDDEDDDATADATAGATADLGDDEAMRAISQEDINQLLAFDRPAAPRRERAAATPGAGEADADSADSEGSNVVTLDAFRHHGNSGKK